VVFAAGGCSRPDKTTADKGAPSGPGATARLTTLPRRPYDEISVNRLSGLELFNMIKVQGLTKRYARTVAVDNISFEVEKGQIVGFLGPNGAGKTTTMRVLTCFLPPTMGTANVAGFDVLENPMEVKKRIGYLPESPPLYPEMEVIEYLTFVGKLKGIPSGDLARRLDDVVGRCAIGDVRTRLIGKLSKGFRQRVGLAQAIIHNPPVLILDEPTSGLDPKQIIEIRELLKSLAGEHTIILSTHILSEVEHSCEHVIIIDRGKLVAIDTVSNLTNRLRGSEAVALEVDAAGGQPSPADVQQRLEQVAGVSRVVMKDSKDGRLTFEVESLTGRHIRAELARTVVHSGWSLTELRAVGLSLEDIFLQLTAAEQTGQVKEGDKQ
jgi:ABC-2 type transport system ATP-binding protein